MLSDTWSLMNELPSALRQAEVLVSGESTASVLHSEFVLAVSGKVGSSSLSGTRKGE